MTHRAIIFRATFAAFTILFGSANALPQQQKPWTWKDKDGKTRTRTDLDKILQNHQTWLNTSHQKGNMADLSKAILTGADLSSMSLHEALLMKADLSGAILFKADLQGASLNHANLSGQISRGRI